MIMINSYLFKHQDASKMASDALPSLTAISDGQKMPFSSTGVLFAYSLSDPAGFSSTERKLNKVPLTHTHKTPLRGDNRL